MAAGASLQGWAPMVGGREGPRWDSPVSMPLAGIAEAAGRGRPVQSRTVRSSLRIVPHLRNVVMVHAKRWSAQASGSPALLECCPGKRANLADSTAASATVWGRSAWGFGLDDARARAPGTEVCRQCVRAYLQPLRCLNGSIAHPRACLSHTMLVQRRVHELIGRRVLCWLPLGTRHAPPGAPLVGSMLRYAT